MTIQINRSISRFTDLNALFTRHPITRDVTVKNDVEAIKFAIKNLVLTRHYEKPFHPEQGSMVYDLLFDNFTPDMVSILQKDIELVIEQYEPRATLLSVGVVDMSDMNELRISITFLPHNLSSPATIDLIIERTK